MTRKTKQLAVAAFVISIAIVVFLLVIRRGPDDESYRPDRTAAPSSTDVIIAAPPGLLGWWDGTRWVQWRPGASVPVRGGEAYRILRFGEPITTGVGSTPNAGCISSDDPPDLNIAFPQARHWFVPAIAVGGRHVLHPRPTEVLDSEAKAYLDAAKDVLRDEGIQDPAPTITQIVRTDLEGDRLDEVVVIVERISDRRTLFGEPGDYSVAFLRRAGDGAVKTDVLAKSKAPTEEGFTPTVLTHRIAAVADLNGDDRMEVVLASAYYEGSSTSVREVQGDGALKEVLSAGCGA